jgi:hypothetical protein
MEEKEKTRNKSNTPSKTSTKKSSEFNIDDILKKILTSRK